MDDIWYCRIGNDTVGPRTRADLEDMRATGQLGPSTPVWREGSAGWILYADSNLASPPAAPSFAANTRDAMLQAPPSPMLEPAMANGASIPSAWREPMDRRAYVPARPVFDGGFASDVSGMPRLAVGDDGWQVTTPAPWRRYFGRVFDITLIGTLIWFSIGFVAGHLSPALHDWIFGAGSLVNNAIVATILTCCVVVPVLALLIGLTGSSPGKWVFGTRITTPEGRPIGILNAFSREVEVLVFGIGFGIPLIALFTLIASKSKLTSDDVSRWDERKGWIVTHRQQGALQVALFVVGVAAWLAANILLRILAE